MAAHTPHAHPSQYAPPSHSHSSHRLRLLLVMAHDWQRDWQLYARIAAQFCQHLEKARDPRGDPLPSFCAREAVAWLVENAKCSTRQQGVCFGRTMLRDYLILPGVGNCDFEDNDTVFRFQVNSTQAILSRVGITRIEANLPEDDGVGETDKMVVVKQSNGSDGAGSVYAFSEASFGASNPEELRKQWDVKNVRLENDEIIEPGACKLNKKYPEQMALMQRDPDVGQSVKEEVVSKENEQEGQVKETTDQVHVTERQKSVADSVQGADKLSSDTSPKHFNIGALRRKLRKAFAGRGGK